MGLHPLTPEGIGHDEQDYWQSYFAKERELRDVQERLRLSADEKTETGKYELLRTARAAREALHILKETIRSGIRHIFEERIDVELLPAEGDWASPSEQEHSIEERFDELSHQMKIFLADQKILEFATRAVFPRGLGSIGHRVSLLPAGSVQELAQLAPSHPRFQLHIERHILLAYRELLLRKYRAKQHMHERDDELWDDIEAVDTCVDLRLRHSLATRSKECNLPSEHPKVSDDIEYEQQNVDQWLREKPTLKSVFWGAAATVTYPFRKAHFPIPPDLLGAKRERPGSHI